MTAPTGTEATTERIAEHRFSPGIEHPTHGRTPYNAGCYCGETFSTWNEDMAWLEYAAHVAEVLSAGVIRDMQAAAWDEGYLRGTLDTTSDLEPADNPHRVIAPPASRRARTSSSPNAS